MYYRDHAPPHFHAVYGDYEIEVEIDSGVVQGYVQHVQELRDNWARCVNGEPLAHIDPLE
jgi:hypothetical protein